MEGEEGETGDGVGLKLEGEEGGRDEDGEEKTDNRVIVVRKEINTIVEDVMREDEVQIIWDPWRRGILTTCLVLSLASLVLVLLVVGAP